MSENQSIMNYQTMYFNIRKKQNLIFKVRFNDNWLCQRISNARDFKGELLLHKQQQQLP